MSGTGSSHRARFPDKFLVKFLWGFLVLALAQQACTITDVFPGLLPTVTPSSTPTPTSTATNTATSTPTDTPTPKATFTRIAGYISPTALSLDGFVPTLPTVVQPEPVSTSTPAKPGEGFELVTISEGSIFYGSCKLNYTKMTVRVEKPDEVFRVYLFYRLESGKKAWETTPWVGTVTDNDGNGTFLYTLRANNIPERGNFIRAWVQYQFVAIDDYGKEVARTRVFTRNILLRPCP